MLFWSVLLLFPGVLPTKALQPVQPEQVLVVANQSSDTSVAIAEYYALLRDIPEENLCRLPVGTTMAESISRQVYEREIRDPIARHLMHHQPHLRAQVRYLVLTRDLPLQVRKHGSGIRRDEASVDSELTQLFTGRVTSQGQAGRLSNPLFMSYQPIAENLPRGISYLVFRLDSSDYQIDRSTGVPVTLKQALDFALLPPEQGHLRLRMNRSHPGSQQRQEILQKVSLARRLEVVDAMEMREDRSPTILDWSWSTPLAVLLSGYSGDSFISTNLSLQGIPSGGAVIADGHVFRVDETSLIHAPTVLRHYLHGIQLGLAFYHGLEWLSWANVIYCDPLMTCARPAPAPPRVSSLEPWRVPLGHPWQRGHVHGENFTDEEDLRLWVGGRECEDVRVLSPKLVSYWMPTLDQGVYDVELETFMGSALQRAAFVVTPALHMEEELLPGQVATLTMFGDQLDHYQLYMGLAKARVSMPPFGDLLIDPGAGLVPIRNGVMHGASQALSGMVHGNPAMTGTVFYLQSLIGPLSPHKAQFSNLVEVRLP
jgi:hypothetical protein